MVDEIKVYKKSKISAEIEVPPDKSITHRAIMFAAISSGKCVIHNYLNSKDCISTINAFRELRIKILEKEKSLEVYGQGLYGLKQPKKELDMGNSGTTTRLISGILAGNELEAKLIGDESLSKRPLKRIIVPLRMMGAKIQAIDDNFLPMTISGTKNLKSIIWDSEIPSAQVKSCILLAGLYAEGETIYSETVLSRDHTERLMKYLNIPLKISGTKIKLKGKIKEIQPFEIKVPNDISSASYFISLGLLVKDTTLIIKNVCVNPTRMGFVNTLLKMGAKINIMNPRMLYNEPIAEIKVESSSLRSIKVEPEDIPSMIDEIPLLSVIATQVDGVTEIRGAQELRVKESDRIKTIVTELKKLGAKIVEQPDGMIIMGNTKLKPATVNSYNDHRIAMSLAVAGSIIDGETVIKNPDCVEISFPGFWELYKSI